MIKNILIGVLFLNALYLGYRCFHQLPTENEMYSQTLAEATKFLKEKNKWEVFSLEYLADELEYIQEKRMLHSINKINKERKANLLAREKLIAKTLTQENMYALQTADTISDKVIPLVPKTNHVILEAANFELAKHSLLKNTYIQYGQSIPFRPDQQVLVPSSKNLSICEGDTAKFRYVIQPNLLEDSTFFLKKVGDLDTLYSELEGGIFIPTHNLLKDGEEAKEITRTKKIPYIFQNQSEQRVYKWSVRLVFTVRKCNN